MGLMDAIYPQLLDRSEAATTRLTDTELMAAAATQQEGERWQQLAADLKFILISTTTGDNTSMSWGIGNT